MYWGLALVSAATLVLQTALTRLFSVIFLYHLALVAVSCAMFGLAAGALIVHAFPRIFPSSLSQERAADCSALFSLSTLLGLIGCLAIPLKLGSDASLLSALAWAAMVVTPFTFSGCAVCLCLTRFPARVGRLYAADLAGAALACLLAVGLMNLCGPINTTLFAAALAATGACLMAQSRRKSWWALWALLLVGGGMLNASQGFLRIRFVKGQAYNVNVRRELWNSFSYLVVTHPDQRLDSMLWGPGTRFKPPSRPPEQMQLWMDTHASTSMLKFPGNWADLEWLQGDVISLAHDVHQEGPVLVIGPGGGRDILTALVPTQGQRAVTGVEINPLTHRVVTEWERNYNRLGDLPGVRYINDEARSWLAGCNEQFQVITVPLVDTWASTSAGAFALSENSLYTVEAFRLYLRHLQPGGVVSICRWWHAGQYGETFRLLNLAAEALRREGVEHPQKHLALVLGSNVVNLLASPQPFTQEAEARVRAACEKRGYQPLILPSQSLESRLGDMLDHPEKAVGWFGVVHLDLSAPSDDRPYFFHCYSLRNLWAGRNSAGTSEAGATLMLARLTIVVSLITALSWLWPCLKARGMAERSLLTYFLCLGFGFMFFESAQMQRLNLFLGYPVYSLTVVLFSLLLASSAGSYWAARRINRGDFPLLAVCGLVTLALIAVNGFTLLAQTHLAPLSLPWRLAIAAGLMALVGAPLGSLFPYGLSLAEKRQAPLAWCWSLNGVGSAAAAVFAITLSLCYGIQVTYWLSLASYLVAFLILVRLRA